MQISVRKLNVFKLASTGMLTAVGILIPMFFPKIMIGPAASYTLASHVAIFIAMYISPGVAAGVVFGTTAGFLFGGFPLVIVFRAASHILWALPGALYLSKTDKLNISWYMLRAFSVVIALIHGVCELGVVFLFYTSTSFPVGIDFLWILSFICLGTIIHSLIDFEISNAVRLVLLKQTKFKELAQ